MMRKKSQYYQIVFSSSYDRNEPDQTKRFYKQATSLYKVLFIIYNYV